MINYKNISRRKMPLNDKKLFWNFNLPDSKEKKLKKILPENLLWATR